MGFWGAVGSALPFVGGAVGSYLGAKENRKASAAANATNMKIAKANMDQQDFYANNGLQIKAMDARKAGLSPLAAMGAPTFSPAPVSAGAVPETGGDYMSSIGQDLGRAAQSMMTHQERTASAAQTMTMNNLQLENQALQNDMLRSQLARINQQSAPPLNPLSSNSEMPLLTGQGNSNATGGYVIEKPMERIHSSPGVPAQEVGTVTDYGFARTNTGLAVVPSKDVKEKIEDQLIPEMMWAVRNQLMPNLGMGGPTPPDPKYYPPPKGSTHWVWNPAYQEFQGNNFAAQNPAYRLYRNLLHGEKFPQLKGK